MSQINGVAEDILLKQDLADYTVETDTIDGWTYRKWHNGAVECWGNFPCTLIWTDVSTTPVVLRYSANRIDVNFPEGLFSETPCVNGEFRSTGIVMTTLGAVDNIHCGFSFVRLLGGSDDITGILHIQVKGSWK